jgi:hypothetical protein
MDIDFGAVEGGLAGLIVIITTVAKWVHRQSMKQVEAQEKQLSEFKEDIATRDEKQDRAAKETKDMLNMRIDRVKDDQRRFAEKTDESVKEIDLKLARILTILDK